jgi:hypothetical protein
MTAAADSRRSLFLQDQVSCRHMDSHTFFQPAQLERNSFLWSEARLVIAAVALFLGGVPPLVRFVGYSGATLGLLKLAWIVSGVASAYLAYRWYTGGQKVFGGKDQKDIAAFAVSVLSGLNLGWTGLSGNNVGMSIASGSVVFIAAGAIYLVAAWHLWSRWKANHERLF